MTQRTTSQHRALMLWERQLADVLSESGYDMKQVLKPSWEIPPTQENVHLCIVRPIVNALYGKQSTTELEKHQIDEVYELINRELGQKLGVEVPDFPHDPTKISDSPDGTI